MLKSSGLVRLRISKWRSLHQCNSLGQLRIFLGSTPRSTIRIYLLLLVINGKWGLFLFCHYWNMFDLIFCYLSCDRFLNVGSILLCRRILIFPKGNNVDHLSMYLDVADSSALPYGWSRYAQFSLAVINQIHHKYSIKKGIFLLILSFLFCLNS